MKKKQLILLAVVFIFNANLSEAQDILPFGTGDKPFEGYLFHSNRVGIGTDNPHRLFHIKKTGTDGACILLENGSGRYWDFLNSGVLKIRGGTSEGMTTYMTIKQNGYLGLGTTDPLAKLHIAGGNAFFESYLGIGTESPDAPIHISSSSMDDHTAIRMKETHSDNSGSKGPGFDYHWEIENSGSRFLFNYAVSSIGGSPTLSEKVSINSAGTLTANSFVGDGSGLTGIGLWEENGDNLFYNGGDVGIGTNEPNHALHLFNGDGSKIAFGDNNTFEYAVQHGGLNVLVGEYGITDSDIMHIHGKNGMYFTYGNYQFANEKISMMIDIDGNIGIGADECHGYKLAVNGKIITEEIMIKLHEHWPDYVFEDNYQLKDIDVLENYIKENKHLPGIPSAEEVEDNGHNLGEMDALLLKKIEELTLYTIQQQKEIESLKKQIRNNKSE